MKPDQVKLSSGWYCFGTWQCYSKHIINDKNTENVLRRGSTSLKCSISDWKNKFHKQRDISFWSTRQQTGLVGWKGTLKSYVQEFWSMYWSEDYSCQRLVNAPVYMRDTLLLLLTKNDPVIVFLLLHFCCFVADNW